MSPSFTANLLLPSWSGMWCLFDGSKSALAVGMDVITLSPLSTRSPLLFFSDDTVGELELPWLAMVLFGASFVELEDMGSPLSPLWSLLVGGDGAVPLVPLSADLSPLADLGETSTLAVLGETMVLLQAVVFEPAPR